MLFANLLLSFTTILAAVLCLLIFVSNPRRRINQVLSVFIFCLFVWLITNLLTNISANPSISLLFARSTLIGAALVPYFFWLFCHVFNGDIPRKRTLIFMFAVPLLVLCTTPTSLNIISVEGYGINTQTGLIYYVLIAEYLLYFFAGLRRLYYIYRSKSVDTTRKTQLRYMFVGVILTLIPGVLANAVLPTLGYDTAVFFGPNAVIFLAVFMSIAIVKHRLLDIRLIVARTLAYIFLLASLIGAYALVVFGFSQNLSGGEIAQFLSNVIPFVAAIFLAVAYRPLKKFFDKVTNRFFYQDAYDPQILLDELNGVLVSTIDLKNLLLRSAGTIQKHIKSESLKFSIQGKEYSSGAFDQNDNKIEFLKKLEDSLSAKKETVVVVDDLEDGRRELRDLLTENNIAIAINLSPSGEKKKHSADFMFLGVKKSGGPYSNQDVRVIEIIANELVIAIQNALRFEEIQNFAKTLQDKVDEATKNLRKANEKLKEMDQTKDDFISMASHQLRTPLTSVKGYISMVIEGDVGKVSSAQRKLLDQAFVSSQRMVYLIADLLNVSRLKTGKFIIEAKAVNLADVVEGEIAQLIETAKGRGLELAYHKPKDFPQLMLDETKIRQVIMNFADNAIYYTPTGGHINVIVEEKADSVEFRVEDDGIGVPKTEQHHLFNKFYRAGNAKKARPDGTGLGLFMAKKVVVAQGGSIIFRSQEGKGSTFGFSFSKSALDPKHYRPVKTTKLAAESTTK